MATMSEDSTVMISDDWREEYKKVINAVVAVAENTNDVSTALVLIKPFLASSPNEYFKEDVPSDVVSILTTLHVRLLIQQAEEENDDSAFDVPLRYIQSISNRQNNEFLAEEAYCYYRMKQYNKAKDICEAILVNDDNATTSSDHDGIRHVYAQTLYRLGDYSNARNVYNQLLSSSPSSSSANVDRNEIYTNAVAALGSQQPEHNDCDSASNTNIVTQMEGLSFEISKMVTLGNKQLRLTDIYSSSSTQDEDDTPNAPPIIPYDLSYNVATALAVHSLEEYELQMATSLLLQSQQACRTSQEAADESDMKSELAPMQCNQAYALIKKMFLLDDTKNQNDDEVDKKRRLAEAFFTKVLKAGGSSSSSIIAMHNLALLQSLRTTSTASSDGTKKNSSFKTKSKSSSPTKAIESALGELQQQQKPSSLSKLNPNQVIHMLQNKALLQLKHGELGQQCQETIDEMRRYHHQECAVSSSTNGGNTSTSNGGKGGKQHRSKKGKQQQQQQPVSRCIEADIVEILLLNQQSKMKDRDSVLREALEANPTSVSLVLLKAQLVLSQSSNSNVDESNQRGLVEEAAQILQSFVDTSTTVPVGVITTLISMYHQCHETSKANELLSQLSSETLQSLNNDDDDDDDNGVFNRTLSTRFIQDIVAKALYLMEMNYTEQAVEILETLLKRIDDNDNDNGDDMSRTMVVAALIKALMANSSSSENNEEEERATTLISELSSFEDDDEMSSADNMDAGELEDTPLPRLARSKKRFMTATATGLLEDGGVDAMLGGDETSRLTNQKMSEKKQRLKEHRLNQRAKKRDEYIQTLKSRGDYNELRPPIPDPERWIPKHQRSSYGRGGSRRHRGRGVIGGAQGAGAGTERDALRLDVAARKKAGDSEPLSSASSTAHMTVATSSGNVKRKGGGGGRKKK